MTDWTMRPFRQADQQAVFDLVIAGLSEHYDDPKPEYNPDLFDIQANYVDQQATFIVVVDSDAIIGCGALIKEHGSDQIARIVRVSVAPTHRRQGMGRAISERLIAIARERGFEKVLVETNHDWESALRLYQECGFTEFTRIPSGYGYDEVHMELPL